MKNYLDGGEALMEAFRRSHVDYILSSPGSEWAPLWEAMARQIKDGTDGPKFIDCWHETLAVNMASGYAQVTGRPQAVVIHTGVGLLQGSMGIQGARNAEVPMVVLSGESTTFGEDPDFDPGAQFQHNLSVPGGPNLYAAPFVKWATHAVSIETLHENVIRAAEMSQRTPKGPTYLSVPLESLVAEWTPPVNPRTVPPAPKTVSPPEDIERIAKMIVAAENPVIVAESAGRDPEAYHAMVELADALAIPVVEVGTANCVNFPKDHPLHIGFGMGDMHAEADLVLLVKSKAPWYPSSKRPPKAKVVAIDDYPHKTHMVYQGLHAEEYLEGDVAASLRGLAKAGTALGPDKAALAARRERYAARHDEVVKDRLAKQQAARDKSPIDPVCLFATLNEVMPDDVIYDMEITTHGGLAKQHLDFHRPQSLFSGHGGLGQGLGTTLGVKLACPDRTVVSLIGDGSFLYNPVTQAFGASRDYKLPILIIVFNNGRYAAMQSAHRTEYPDGVAATTDTWHGVNINGPEYQDLVAPFGFHGEKVDDPNELNGALQRALDTVKGGRTALVNVVLSR